MTTTHTDHIPDDRKKVGDLGEELEKEGILTHDENCPRGNFQYMHNSEVCLLPCTCPPVEEWDKNKYVAMWDAGKFCWNDNINNPINPERIWQVFIEPLIDSFTAKVEEARKEGEHKALDKAAKLAERLCYSDRDIENAVATAKREWVERVREDGSKKLPDALHLYGKWLLENPRAEPLQRRAKKNEIVAQYLNTLLDNMEKEDSISR